MSQDAKPTRKPLEFRRTCAECGAEFTTNRRGALFCSAKHKQAHHNRQAERGRQIMVELMAARAARNSGETASKAWAFARSKIDQFIREDREAGRMPSLELAELRKAWMN